MSNSKPTQPNLFDVDKITEVEPARQERWYYVTNPANTKMLVSDDGGKFMWTDADTQYHIPYLWNSPGTAKRDVKRGRWKGVVRRYPFSSSWRNYS